MHDDKVKKPEIINFYNQKGLVDCLDMFIKNYCRNDRREDGQCVSFIIWWMLQELLSSSFGLFFYLDKKSGKANKRKLFLTSLEQLVDAEIKTCIAGGKLRQTARSVIEQIKYLLQNAPADILRLVIALVSKKEAVLLVSPR